MIYHNIQEYIGNTPLVEVPQNIHGTDNVLLAKLEYFNPTHSLKDRIATAMIEDAEEKGFLKKGTTIVEPTSGNTGIALAFACRLKGYKLVLTMPENASEERKKMALYLGAELLLTDKNLGFQGAIDLAFEVAEKRGGFVFNQYNYPANLHAHYKSTGAEIFNQTNGEVDMFIAGVGTGGCLCGVSKYLKENCKHDVYTIGIEPIDNDILDGGTKYSPHALQGIGPNFVPKNFDKSLVNEVFHCSKDDAYNTTRMLALNAGILGGISGGATAYCALQKAKQVSKKTIVFLVADFCERYVSCDLFDLKQ